MSVVTVVLCHKWGWTCERADLCPAWRKHAVHDYCA